MGASTLYALGEFGCSATGAATVPADVDGRASGVGSTPKEQPELVTDSDAMYNRATGRLCDFLRDRA